MTSPGNELEPVGYAELLADLKARVRATRFRAARAANTEVLRLYWSVGHDILERQRTAGWGSKVVTSLAANLQREFPDQRGWSRSNLLYMRRAAETWPTEEEFVHHVGGRLPWRHVTVLLDRLKSREERDWYAARAVEDGWSRAVLEHQIKADLRGAIGAAPTNFTAALEAPDSEMAQQLVKDPYVFEHLAMVERVAERDVEQALMDRLQDTMLELGRSMAFVGRQVRLSVPDDASDRVDEFFVDLLFFHVEQLRYVVVELKIGSFEPGHVGQLGTYVAIVDDQFRRPEIHAPTIGILLCTGKSGPTVRYALASTSAPVAVADYQGLPADARGVLPSAAELEAVIEDELDHRP
ncbi:PDDEXK nuclease domain-containing protein [Isoptericola croceus]|uniref:PDDEXK nuclease domain-containing protein n=1 Tax=Isoptericola croceus TaxID=3031406 RepID=UPI0023F6E08E|nr:PDDEXK nuclease domain-containing protein [Isoptericola croceus]